MPILKKVRLIRQLDDHLCGAAAAEMMLDYRELKPLGMSDAAWQRHIMDKIMSATTGPNRLPAVPDNTPGYIEEFAGQQCLICGDAWGCWATTPQALREVLNDELALDNHVSILRASAGTPEVAVDAFLNSIDAEAPAAVMVDDGDHWVVVCGYKAGQSTPTPVPIFGRNLNGVYIRDPWPGTPSRQLIAAEEFMDERFFPVDCGLPVDKDKYVVVVDRAAMRQERRVAQPIRAERGEVAALLSPEAARAAATDHAKVLLEEDKDELRPTDPLLHAVAGTPELVQRLDRDDNYYYIVPFEFHGQITSRMAIDAKTGHIKEVQWIEDDSSSLPRWQPRDAFARKWAGQPYPGKDADQDQPARRARVVRAETLGVHPVLVWRPCPQSRSIFAPFQLVLIGDERVYVKVDDGVEFTRLTKSGKG